MINETRLKNTIVDAINECQQIEDDANSAKDILAGAIASAVIKELTEAVVVGVCPENGGPLGQGKIT